MTPFIPGMLNGVTRGDCVEVMKAMPAASADFILTDPPYLVRYCDRSGRTVANDDNDAWIDPAFAQMHRVLKDSKFCVSFYAWNKVDRFVEAWRKAGFRIAGHVVFPKTYASSSRFMSYQHEQAYLLVKGNPDLPDHPPPDVIPWTYTGNRLHPTQKPVGIFKPLIEAFTKLGDIILDPFCGSGSTLVAARDLGRQFIGIEMDPVHHATASRRLQAGPRELGSIKTSSFVQESYDARLRRAPVITGPLSSKFHEVPSAPPCEVVKAPAIRVNRALNMSERAPKF